MRTTQFIGLSSKAKNFLSENAEHDMFKLTKNLDEVVRTWSEPKRVEGKFSTEGMFEEKIQLKSFVLKDGRIVHENVQAEIWSSGPMIYTHLVDNDGEVIEGTNWNEKEFN